MTGQLRIPEGYTPTLSTLEVQQNIKGIKEFFQQNLAKALNLQRVSAPLFVRTGTGINDDLNGIERPVRFNIRDDGDASAEIVHSLAKWKRLALAKYGFEPGTGLYTDMNAIRPDEDLDNTHSIYVDQWDWERVLRPDERNLDMLMRIVRRIYSVLRQTEYHVASLSPHIVPVLPDEITFITAEELQAKYPDLHPREREDRACEKYGAVFVIGIGGVLSDGQPHDGRAPDYDDWSTPRDDGGKGLNGDILVWHPVLKSAFELSSMGIRVDGETLRRQLALCSDKDRAKLDFHRMLLDGQLPQTMGGGIGQSRLCMFFLRTAHIGEVAVGIWPDEMVLQCAKNNINLL